MPAHINVNKCNKLMFESDMFKHQYGTHIKKIYLQSQRVCFPSLSNGFSPSCNSYYFSSFSEVRKVIAIVSSIALVLVLLFFFAISFFVPCFIMSCLCYGTPIPRQRGKKMHCERTQSRAFHLQWK